MNRDKKGIEVCARQIVIMEYSQGTEQESWGIRRIQGESHIYILGSAII